MVQNQGTPKRDPPSMKLSELKSETFHHWKDYTECYGKALIQPEKFHSDIRREFGDLRKRSTWETAYCRYKAMVSQIGLLDADRLILYDFNFTSDRPDYPYRHRILEEWLTFPDGLDLIRLGLEQLFSSDYTDKEREQANGFFEMVRESTRGELSGSTTEHSRLELLASAIAC